MSDNVVLEADDLIDGGVDLFAVTAIPSLVRWEKWRTAIRPLKVVILLHGARASATGLDQRPYTSRWDDCPAGVHWLSRLYGVARSWACPA